MIKKGKRKDMIKLTMHRQQGRLKKAEDDEVREENGGGGREGKRRG